MPDWRDEYLENIKKAHEKQNLDHQLIEACTRPALLVTLPVRRSQRQQLAGTGTGTGTDTDTAPHTG